MSLGNKLYELRKSKNLSQEDLAEKLNVTRQTVSKWETDQSTPDFDQIIPLCNLFEISANDLLDINVEITNNEKNINNEAEVKRIQQEKEEKRKQKLGIGIGIGVAGYFLAVVWIMIAIPVLMINPVLAAGIFLLFCGLATGVIVYTSITCKKEETAKEKKESQKLKSIKQIIDLVTLTIYLVISFLTMAWYITWIIWIVDALVFEIVKLIISVKEDDVNE
jgi:transcriptional regulator with XRE-family HTH domain